MTVANTSEGPLERLFLNWLLAAHRTENQVAEEIPRWIDQIGAGPLKQVLLICLDRTGEQTVRLREILEIIGEEVKDGPPAAIGAVLAEGQRAIEEIADDTTSETAILAVARTVAAHEIARYQALVTWSKELGRENCTALLEQSLAEEVSADEMLRKAAEERQNRSG